MSDTDEWSDMGQSVVRLKSEAWHAGSAEYWKSKYEAEARARATLAQHSISAASVAYKKGMRDAEKGIADWLMSSHLARQGFAGALVTLEMLSGKVERGEWRND